MNNKLVNQNWVIIIKHRAYEGINCIFALTLPYTSQSIAYNPPPVAAKAPQITARPGTDCQGIESNL